MRPAVSHPPSPPPAPRESRPAPRLALAGGELQDTTLWGCGPRTQPLFIPSPPPKQAAVRDVTLADPRALFVATTLSRLWRGVTTRRTLRNADHIAHYEWRMARRVQCSVRCWRARVLKRRLAATREALVRDTTAAFEQAACEALAGRLGWERCKLGAAATVLQRVYRWHRRCIAHARCVESGDAVGPRPALPDLVSAPDDDDLDSAAPAEQRRASPTRPPTTTHVPTRPWAPRPYRPVSARSRIPLNPTMRRPQCSSLGDVMRAGKARKLTYSEVAWLNARMRRRHKYEDELAEARRRERAPVVRAAIAARDLDKCASFVQQRFRIYRSKMEVSGRLMLARYLEAYATCLQCAVRSCRARVRAAALRKEREAQIAQRRQTHRAALVAALETDIGWHAHHLAKAARRIQRAWFDFLTGVPIGERGRTPSQQVTDMLNHSQTPAAAPSPSMSTLVQQVRDSSLAESHANLSLTQEQSDGLPLLKQSGAHNDRNSLTLSMSPAAAQDGSLNVQSEDDDDEVAAPAPGSHRRMTVQPSATARDENNAAVKIQALVRRGVARRRAAAARLVVDVFASALERHAREVGAAAVAEAAARERNEARAAAAERHQQRAVRQLQAAGRAALARRFMRGLRVVTSSEATARTAMARDAHRLAATINADAREAIAQLRETEVRARKAREAAARAAACRDGAALLLQRSGRGLLVRSLCAALAQLAAAEAAARESICADHDRLRALVTSSTLQASHASSFRGSRRDRGDYAARAAEEERREHAAVLVQRCWRSVALKTRLKAHKSVLQLGRRADAARKIQAVGRAQRGRERLRAKLRFVQSRVHEDDTVRVTIAPPAEIERVPKYSSTQHLAPRFKGLAWSDTWQSTEASPWKTQDSSAAFGAVLPSPTVIAESAPTFYRRR